MSRIECNFVIFTYSPDLKGIKTQHGHIASFPLIFTYSPDLKGIKTFFAKTIRFNQRFTYSPDLKGIKTDKLFRITCPQCNSHTALI